MAANDCHISGTSYEPYPRIFCHSAFSLYFFGGCVINDVTLPKNLKTIKAFAFRYCTSETELVIPKTLEALYGYSFFYGTYSHITFEEGIESIDIFPYIYHPVPVVDIYYNNPFQQTVIGEMTLPGTLKSIGNYFLYAAKGPAKLVLPEGLMSVGDYAFYNNKAIYELYLSSTVEFVDGTNAFYNWTEEQTIYSPLSRSATMAVWGGSLTHTSFGGNVVYNYVPTPEQTENSGEIAIEGEVAFVDNKQN